MQYYLTGQCVICGLTWDIYYPRENAQLPFVCLECIEESKISRYSQEERRKSHKLETDGPNPST